ncbi:MAG: ATP-binding cassette domain-containing protein, partial [Parasporobacterium sp.]|nr:ATP-binding cassette domain-containing protein [Parasporobacterium sp.]
MQIIKSDSISYTYPVMEQVDDYDGRTSVNKEATAQAEPVLKDVSLTVEPGQFICILGHNGSGKSTFARHLNGLLTPDSGTLWIDGMDTKDEEKIWQIRSAVGMVFQNPDNQIIGTVVDEDVAFGPENLGVPSEEIIQR